MARGKLPFLSKSYRELGLLGRVSYIASAITAVVAAGVSIWQVWAWASNRMDVAERTALWQAESVLRMEAHMIEDHTSTRYIEIQEQLKIINKALDD